MQAIENLSVEEMVSLETKARRRACDIATVSLGQDRASARRVLLLLLLLPFQKVTKQHLVALVDERRDPGRWLILLQRFR